MKQLRLRFLLAFFIAGSWLSLEVVQCHKMPKGTYNISYCYNKTSGKTCFTTILANNSKAWRKNFTAAKDLCKAYVPGSSLIVINSLEDQRYVEGFIGRQAFEDEIVFTDAQKISERKRLEWSWVNGHQTVPNEFKDTDRPFHDGACVVFEVAKPLAYCVDNVAKEYNYICEYSDSKLINSYQENNKSYVASNSSATWYDARSECLRLRGDLASLVDLERIHGSSWLKDKNRYWIGLHRNQWFWNSTGAALTYTNWEGGYPDDSADKECICLRCNMINKITICDDRKWWSCNCTHSYPLVCQHEEATEIVNPTAMLSSSSADFKSSTSFPVLTNASFLRTSSSSSAITMTTTTIPTTETTAKATTKSTTKSATKATTKATTKAITKTTIKTTTKSTTSTHATSVTIATTTNTSTPHKTTFESGLNKAFTMKEILFVVLLFVVVVFIVVAVILVLRKRKYARRNEESSLKATKQQNEQSAYVTVVPHNGSSDGTVPPSNTIYAEVEMNQRPTPSSNAIYASVQPTGEAVDTGKSVVYADLDFVQNVQKKPKSSDKIAACLSPIYANPCDAFTSDGNAVYAEPFKPDRPPTVHANIYHQ